MSVLINLLFFMLSCFAVYKAYKRNEKSHVIVKFLWMIFAFFMSIPYLIGILIYDKFVKRESEPGQSDSEQSDPTTTTKGESNETKKVTFSENDVVIE